MADGNPLDPSEPVPAERAPLFEWLCDHRPGGSEIRQAVHERELDVASQPPVINVTVTSPDGVPVPGHFRLDMTKPQPEICYREEDAPRLEQTRALYHVVRNGRVEPGGWPRA